MKKNEISDSFHPKNWMGSTNPFKNGILENLKQIINELVITLDGEKWF